MRRFEVREGSNALFLFALLCSCGSSSTQSPTSDSVADDTSASDAAPDILVGCAITLSGALSGTFPCTASAAWATSTNKSGVGALVGNPAPLKSLQFSIVRNGKPVTGTLKSSDAGASSGWIVRDASGGQWGVRNDDAGPTGSFTLVLTQVLSTGATAGGETFSIVGTLDAKLEPIAGGATGSVTLHANLE